jgi:uncharacterized protein YcnI
MKAIARLASGGVAVLVCALAAHAAVYRSFWPGDAAHGYFGWYEPLVGVLSGTAAAIVVLAIGLGLRARGAEPSRRERAILAWLRPWRGPSRLVGTRLAVFSLGALLLQESAERSVGLHHVAFASFQAWSWAVVLASIAVGASVFVSLARRCVEFVEAAFGRERGFRPAAEPAPPRPVTSARRRPNPLASRLGMRAPPLVSSSATWPGRASALGMNEGRPEVKHTHRRARLAVALATVLVAALAIAASASAHAIVSPAVVKANVLQQFTLSVPTEKEGSTTTKVELTVPAGFTIDSFEPPPVGWTQQVHATGSGEEAVVQSVTWTGGHVPTGQDAVFRFNATAAKSGTTTFDVRQTYSDGSVVDWNGPEGSDDPAPTVQAVSSFSSGGSSTLAIVAVVLAAAALLIAVAGLFRGKRSLA